MSSDTLPYASLEEIHKAYDQVKKTFRAGTTRPLSYRRQQLLQLARMMQDNVAAFQEALLSDLGKQRQEATAFEVAPIIANSLYAVEHLEEWATPEKPEVQPWQSSWDSTVYHVPKGVVLLISPWNFPVILSFNPLIGAIAAGCPTVIKPSESSPATSALIARLVPKYLDPAAYRVITGAIEEAKALLELQWAHIFFTGSTRVGRIIAAAAAKYNTPVTLELGGKSPVIISPDYDLDLAAKRLLYGKVQNVGQLCVSPDHVYVPRSISKAFQEALKKVYGSFFPTDPLAEDSKWGKIINEGSFKRVKRLIENTRGEVILGGKANDEQRRIALTIVAGVKLDDPLMQEEIFGPVLPIIEVEDVDDAIHTIADRPYPLVIYVFTNSEEVKEKVFFHTNSGTVVLNDTQIQLSVDNLPFGGHGESGYGAYGGKATYDIFNHRRGYINVPKEMEPFYQYRYLPYSEEGYKAMTATIHAEIPKA